MDRSELALVAPGGSAGVTLRCAVSIAIPGVDGTLAVSVPRSFASGTLITLASSYQAQLFFGIGLLPPLAMYSTFVVQTASLSPMGGVLNVGTNYILGFAAVALDLTFGGRW